MTIISNLLESQRDLHAELDQHDYALIEERLIELLEEDDRRSVTDAVAILAEDYLDHLDDLLAALKDHWALVEGYENLPSPEQLSEASLRRKARRGYVRGKAAHRKAKRSFDRAKNSKTGKAVRRFAKSRSGQMLKKGALSLMGF